MLRLFSLFLSLLAFNAAFAECGTGLYPFQDTKLPVNIRVKDLIARMTLQEKLSQLGNDAQAIPALGIAEYHYWNEALHGVMTSGATSFPQAIALSSSWDRELIFQVASAISDEARVKNNTEGKGLTYWSPVINMARDPRWGRTEETYGEDPYLTSQVAMNFIRGMQGNDPIYLKTVATVKHFACNNIEFERHKISSNVDERSLREYYLPAFKECVTKSRVHSVMSAYNALNEVPCPVNRTLLMNILRNEWGFNGYVVSDCDAIDDVHVNHGYVKGGPEATALAIQAGTDLNCGMTYQIFGNEAISSGLMTLAEVDTALVHIFTARFLLGEFDPPVMVSYKSIPDSRIDCQEFRDLALRAARESIVLLKNYQGILPLNRNILTRIAVIGPNANIVQLGGYSGTPNISISPLQGIQKKLSESGVTISYAPGCSVSGPKDQAAFDLAVNLAGQADVAIVVCGTDLQVASEGSDRSSLSLPGVQDSLVEAVVQANPRTIVVLVTGFPVAINRINDLVPGIISAWYDGQAQGSAIADVLFGDYNPGGKLTSTWYRSVIDLPPMDHYDIKENRTYQYFNRAPLFPFGHGLSYTTFGYSNLLLNKALLKPGDSLAVRMDVKNTCEVAGDEVSQLYIHHVSSAIDRPLKELKGFQRVFLQPGESKTVTFSLKHEDLARYDEFSRTFRVDDGVVDIMTGSSSGDIRLSGQVQVQGGMVAGTYRQDAFSRMKAENFEKKSKPLSIVKNSEGGRSISITADNDYAVYKNVDFGTGVTHLDASIELDAETRHEGILEIRLDSLSGPVAGLMLLNNGARAEGYHKITCTINGVADIHDLFLVFKNSGNGFCRMSWFVFRKELPVAGQDKYDIRLYPDPASYYFGLMVTCSDTSVVTVEIFTLDGSLIRSYSNKAFLAGINRFFFNTVDAGLKQGLYVVRCTVDGYRKSLKLCIVD